MQTFAGSGLAYPRPIASVNS